MSLEIVVATTRANDAARVAARGLGNRISPINKTITLTENEFSERWSQFVHSLSNAFQCTENVAGLPLSEVKVSVGISAEGKFQLFLGASVESSVNLELVFKKDE